jgi:microcystin-dependent protein
LQSNGTSAPSWVSVGDISAGTAQTANSLSGGAAGSIPYQNAPGSTVFLTEPNGDDYVLTYDNTSDAPQWQQLSSIDRTYTLDSVDSGDNVILRLSDGSANDDVTITAGSNIQIDSVSSSGFTISAVADGDGGILSDVNVVQENYGCTNPITTATNAGITTITIGENSNAYGTRYVQETEPTGVCDGDIWYDTSDAGGSGNPAGTVIYSASSTTVPAGYIKANGAGLSTTTYADLFAAIGYTYGGSGSSFNVPDLRGEFIRGFDDGKGVDSGRTLGSTQTDQNKSHTHTATTTIDDHTHTGTTGNPSVNLSHSHDITAYTGDDSTSGLRYGNNGDFEQSGTTDSSGDLDHTHSFTTDGAALIATTTLINSGGTEARPRNIALLACIKY